MLVGLAVAVIGVGGRRWAPRRRTEAPARAGEAVAVSEVPVVADAGISTASAPAAPPPRTAGRRKGHVTLEMLIDDDDAAVALSSASEGSARETPELLVVPVPVAALPAPRTEEGAG
jgi:hypothetical protein